MKRINHAISALLLLSSFFAQAQTVVESVEPSVSGDKIQVSCILSTSVPVDLFLSYSENGTDFFPCNAVSGDILSQSSGRKIIVWDYSKDDIIMGNFIFKVHYAHSKQVEAVDDKPRPQVTDKPRARTDFLLMSGMAIGKPISYSIEVGIIQGGFGGYAKYKSNFASKDGNSELGENLAFFDSGYSNIGRTSIGAGLLFRIATPLYLKAGAGYGSQFTEWKTTDGNIVAITEYSFAGVEPEVGLVLKASHFVFGAGVSALIGKQTVMDANVSVGVIF